MAKKVFVSGCYDMLHSGHVAFFEEAASYGDLYVGLGSDQTIWGLKARKTINNNAERLYMVKAIKFVKDAWINSGNGIMDFEKEVIELRYGLTSKTPKTLDECGEFFGLSKERIRQIEAKALRKLRNPARANRLRVFMEA